MSSTLFFNANIYTVDNSFSVANAMLIENEKIKAIGDLNSISIDNNCIRQDCKGANIYPGFIDPHGHFIDLGKSFFTAKLYDAKSLADVLQSCQKFQESNPASWLVGRGWNQNNWEKKELPNRELLDRLFPDTPVLLIRIDSHVGLLNQKAIELSGLLNVQFSEPNQVEFIDGKPTGIVFDKALYHVLEFVKPDETTKIKYIQKATDICLALGLTSIGDAFMTYEDFLVYKKMNEENTLRINVYGMLVPSAENKNYLIKFGAYKQNKLSVRAVKHFSDGALGSRGAALLEPYTDAIETKGMLLETNEYWEEEAKFCIDHQLQMVTHAIGDAANKRIIKLYEKFLPIDNQLRWRVEHLQMIDDDDLAILKKCKIVPSVQSTHGTSDYSWAVNRIGAERMKKAYRIKDLLNTCGRIANGSDFPIEKPNPLRGFYAAITRKDDQHLPAEGFDPSQKLERIDALKSMTCWAAYAQFEETFKGSLAVGMNADFVVVNQDLMTCAEDEILKSTVLSTYINGEKLSGND